MNKTKALYSSRPSYQNRIVVAKEPGTDMYGELQRTAPSDTQSIIILSTVIHVVSVPSDTSVFCDLGQDTARELF